MEIKVENASSLCVVQSSAEVAGVEVLPCSSIMYNYYIIFFSIKEEKKLWLCLERCLAEAWSAGRKATLRVWWIKKWGWDFIHAPQIWCKSVISPCLSGPYLFIHPHVSSTCQISFPFFCLTVTNPAAGGASYPLLPRLPESTKTIWNHVGTCWHRSCWQITAWLNAKVKVVLVMGHTHLDRNMKSSGFVECAYARENVATSPMHMFL